MDHREIASNVMGAEFAVERAELLLGEITYEGYDGEPEAIRPRIRELTHKLQDIGNELSNLYMEV